MNNKLSYEELIESVNEARANVLANPLCGGQYVLDIHTDLIFGLVLLAEYYNENDAGMWEITKLAEEFMRFAFPMEQYDECLDDVYDATKRMSDLIESHPRLKLRMLRFELQLVVRLECKSGDVSPLCESVQEEILILENNIRLADNNEFDKIEGNSFPFKKDPVEWTEKFENVIDEAERMTHEAIKDECHGMGFCHTYWCAKKNALRKLGVDWKMPSEINPNVLFD